MKNESHLYILCAHFLSLLHEEANMKKEKKYDYILTISLFAVIIACSFLYIMQPIPHVHINIKRNK